MDVTRAGPTACKKMRRAELGMINEAVALRLLTLGLAPWWLMPFLAGQSELVFCADGMRVFSGRRGLAGGRFQKTAKNVAFSAHRF